MARLTRRRFLGTSLAAAGAVALPRRKALGNVLGANDKIRVAVAGFRSRGMSHIGAFAGMKDVEVIYLIDPDTRVWDQGVNAVDKRTGKKPQTLKDVRKALEDKNLDAISTASPNHWHALITIWGCQAGKHVYVEKPMCHNALEGQIAVEASKRYKKVVQHGTQQRSESPWAQAAAITRSGKLGKIKLVRGTCYKYGEGPSTRGDIGTAPIQQPPEGLDFDLWLGPAPEQAYHENLVPYRWHWFWDFGNGDMGNQGVHQMDVVHWLLPEGTKMPKSAMSVGGRFKFKDQGQVPNTLISVFDFDGIPAIFETRGILPNNPEKDDIGNSVVLEQGELRRAGKELRFFPFENGKLSDKPAPLPEVDFHVEPGGPFGNFINAIRADDIAKANAPAERAFYPCAMIHLGNASYRLGQPTRFDKSKNAFKGNEPAAAAFDSMEEYLVKCGIELDETDYILGRHLSVPDKASWKTTDEQANALLSGAKQYRGAFSLPSDLVAKS